jgi:hypothetical protein
MLFAKLFNIVRDDKLQGTCTGALDQLGCLFAIYAQLSENTKNNCNLGYHSLGFLFWWKTH